ncbi:DNA polymerase III subunit delta' [Desnuesiella massiliensis]|uniref:DNA polymerase III subunit delta' n=1 Tax=Desnuesiella massiliensis TaxID=1650662 RepID=UPI0006E43758|nr:DNA polymerase III subunit delta' [Desnuesiella massiliensis]
MKDFIGHENIIRSFDMAIASEKLSHAHLIVGEDGLGKSVVAKDFALKILGKKDNKQYADILEFRNSKKSIGVDEIRKIIDETNKKPYEGDKKVVIIYDGDKLTTQAQNAFLKTIEEPPKGVYIIILSENIEAILNTIRSRCQIHKLKRLSVDEIREFISKKYGDLDSKYIDIINTFSDGIPGRAEKFIEDNVFNELRALILDIIKKISEKNINNIIKYEENLIKYKDFYEEILNIFLLYIRDIIMYKELGNDNYILNRDKIHEIKELSNMLSFKTLDLMINVINETRYTLDSNVSASMTFDVMLLNMLEV